MNFILGGRGRLGQAIRDSYSEGQCLALDRSVYAAWATDHASDAIARHLRLAGADENSIIYVASGLLDPRSSEADLRSVNYLLPRNVIEAATQLGCKAVTFGTVMETLLHRGNTYVRSKIELGRYIDDTAPSRVTHIRIHTLYGGHAPSPFMLLGQMQSAIRENRPFAMTQGRQLREYHHVDDDVAAIRTLISADMTGALDVSHGDPVSLRDLAEHVFASLDAVHLLKLGALPEPDEENYARVFARPAALEHVRFRKTLPAVADYMKQHTASSVGNHEPGADRGGQ